MRAEIADVETQCTRQPSTHFVFAPQYRAKLDALTKLIERTQLRPVIDAIFPWHQVVQAHQRLEQGGTRGKVVLQFAEN